MTKKLLLGASALALVAGLGLSTAYANPTAIDNEDNDYSDIGNVYNEVDIDIDQDADADAYAGASADYNSYWSDASASASAEGGDAGYNGTAVSVAVEVGNVAIISENEMEAYVSNSGDVSAYAFFGGADASTGDASQNDYQQKYAAGLFNNALNTGLGSAQQQGNSVAVNVDTLTF